MPRRSGSLLAGRSTHVTACVDVEGLAGDGFAFGEEDGDAGDFVG
jgi:hypothetical protein